MEESPKCHQTSDLSDCSEQVALVCMEENPKCHLASGPSDYPAQETDAEEISAVALPGAGHDCSGDAEERLPKSAIEHGDGGHLIVGSPTTTSSNPSVLRSPTASPCVHAKLPSPCLRSEELADLFDVLPPTPKGRDTDAAAGPGVATDFPANIQQDAANADDPKQKKKKTGVISFNAARSDYEVVAATAVARGWRVVKVAEKAGMCNVHWIDDGTIPDWFRKVEPWMRVNHFPGMNHFLARKTRLARNITRMQRLFPKDYLFMPPTWVIPDDLSDLEKRFGESGESKTTYIVKPDHLCQGRGIFLTADVNKLRSYAADCRQKDQTAVVQRYIARPMLIDGLKFDLRLYFLVAGKTGANGNLDLRCFLFRDGLVRLCTTAYCAPTPETLHEKCMHLTNYAINKNSEDFQQNDGENEGTGSKRHLRWFMDWVEKEFGEKERKRLWHKLTGLCVKTVLMAQPNLQAECDASFPKDLSGGMMGCRCFEILGVDVMIDAKRKPYLIEVNHLPSFTCDSPLDESIKSRLVEQTLELTCGTLSPKDHHVYKHLVRERRDAVGTGSICGPADVTNSLLPPEELVPECADQSMLDLPEYKDFERAFPLPDEGATKLAATCQAILARVQELFQPAIAGRRRSSSKDLARPAEVSGSNPPAPGIHPPPKPPPLPSSFAGGVTSGANVSNDHTYLPLRPKSSNDAVKANYRCVSPVSERTPRSQSAPLPHNQPLPPIPGATRGSPERPMKKKGPESVPRTKSGRSRSHLSRAVRRPCEDNTGVAFKKPLAPARIFLEMKTVQIIL